MKALRSILILILCLSGVIATSFAEPIPKIIRAENNMSLRKYKVSEFDRIVVNGSFEVEYAKGGYGVTVESPTNVLQYIEVKKKKNSLVISIRKGINIRFRNNHIKVKISTPVITSVELNGSGEINFPETVKSEQFAATLNGSGDLRFAKGIEMQSDKQCALTLNGSGDITVGGKLQGTAFNLSLQGSGDLRVKSEIDCERVSMLLAGSGDVTAKRVQAVNTTFNIAGSGDMTIGAIDCTNATFGIEGSGDLKATGVTAVNVKVQITGSADAEINNINASKVDASIYGSGDIKLSGTTKDAKYRSISSSSIKAYELLANNVKATVSGSGDIYCYASNSLISEIAEMSGDVYYKGNPHKVTNINSKHAATKK